MQKNKKSKSSLIFLATASILSALSILLGKYLAINLGETIRISFENFPIILAGFYFGPLLAVSVGVVADLVGCLLVGYSINPIITIGAAAIGFCAGVLSGKSENKNLVKILISVFSAHLLGSVLIKTFGLSLYYGMPFFVTLGWRSLTYLLIGSAESILLYSLSISHNFTQQMKNFKESFKNIQRKTK